MASGGQVLEDSEILKLKERQESLLEKISCLCLRFCADELVSLETRQASILNQLCSLEQRLDSAIPELGLRGPPSCNQNFKLFEERHFRNGGGDGSACQNKTYSPSELYGSRSDVETRLTRILTTTGATFLFKRVPADYYERSFLERRDLLGASSIDHLCKSIVMVNSQAPDNIKDCSDRNNSKYYLIVIQYTARLNAEKVRQFVYSLNNGRLPKKKINMRLAPEAESNALTGFEHNAVTPFGMLTNIPVILSDAIVRLQPEFFWLGGGEVDLKLGIRTQDFIRILDPFIADCLY
ncbi:hypothetical protein R1sor_006833 [Riccia sorocarpa]|uniref:YbaK/aminoacyl-tRNA synthetase-associated domain-containing protein n=1 Tax=Riccia sorocarpa TaxID=122646 RepID=A0ABD3HNN0_9MARC